MDVVIFFKDLNHCPITCTSINSPENKPPEVIINEYAQIQLQDMVQKMRERTATYKEKVTNPVISSPEISPTACKL